ncbi:hypothetical protein GQ457_13G003200 [Hibiscus cannabinus]
MVSMISSYDFLEIARYNGICAQVLVGSALIRMVIPYGPKTSPWVSSDASTQSGYMGLLRNAANASLIIFSKPVGVTDATSAELLALKQVCTLFSKSKWSKSFKQILEIDCSMIIDWLNRPSLAPAVFKPDVLEYLELCTNFKWSIGVVPMSVNSSVDKLAKFGIYRASPFESFTVES